MGGLAVPQYSSPNIFGADPSCTGELPRVVTSQAGETIHEDWNVSAQTAQPQEIPLPRRTMTVMRIGYHKVRQPKAPLDVANLPDGRDLLLFFHKFVDDIQSTPGRLVLSALEKYSSIEAVHPAGRTVSVVMEVGRFGESGRVKNVRTHAEEHQYDGGSASAVTTSSVLLVPKTGTSALLYLERASGGQTGMTRLVDLFAEEFRSRYPEYILRRESIVESDAWLQHAKLKQVSAVLHGHSTDMADGKPAVAGDLRHTLTPSRGSAYLPDKLLSALRDRKIKRSSLLGFVVGGEPDEVEISLESGSRRKTFVLGREKAPAIRYVVTNAGERALDHNGILKFVLDEAGDHFKALGVDWEYAHSVGQWTAEDLQGGS